MMKVGSIVKWRDATVDGDNLLKVIIEDNGDRVIIEEIDARFSTWTDNGDRVIIEEIDARFSTWTIKPRFLARKSDLIEVGKDQLQY